MPFVILRNRFFKLVLRGIQGYKIHQRFFFFRIVQGICLALCLYYLFVEHTFCLAHSFKVFLGNFFLGKSKAYIGICGRCGVVGVFHLLGMKGDICLHLAPERSLILSQKNAIITVFLKVGIYKSLRLFVKGCIGFFPLLKHALACRLAFLKESILRGSIHIRKLHISAPSRHTLQIKSFVKSFAIRSIICGNFRNYICIAFDILLPMPKRISASIELQGVGDICVELHLLASFKPYIVCGRFKEDAVRGFVIPRARALSLGVKNSKFRTCLMVEHKKPALRIYCAAILEILLLLGR